MEATLAPTGRLGLKVIPRVRKAPLLWKIKNLPNMARGLFGVLLGWTIYYLTGIPVMISTLRLRHTDGRTGIITDYGIVGFRVVTTAGVGYIVDAFANSVELENMKFHGFGTGGSAEAVGNTALTTELTTEYATDNTRPTGTTAEGASANIFQSVATFSPNAGGTIAVTEHGIFSQAATGGGVLLDRTLFSAVNVVASSDSLQATYELTFTAGS
jgi:hypothetical protein